MADPVKHRARTSLRRILDDVGSTLLDVVLGSPASVGDIGGVVIHDPYDEPEIPECSIVLAVGVHAPDDVVDLLARVSAKGAAAVVLRAPVLVDDRTVEVVNQSGVVLLALARGASWSQLMTLLRSTLSGGEVAGNASETLGGIPTGDLFAVANAVSALLDAPVTIEDRSLRVLAFSGRQDEVDQSRVQTVLGRQVPEPLMRALDSTGFLPKLYRSDRPLFLDPALLPISDVVLPRVAIAVRAGDEVLGSMWAAVRGPLSAERERAFVDSAKLVALHLLRHRAGADVERRLRADLVATVLEGGPNSREAASRLRLARQHVVVLALAQGEDSAKLSAARIEAERERLAGAYALHLSAVHPDSAVALLGGVVYGILPVASTQNAGEDRPLRVAQDFLQRIGKRGGGFIGVGRVAMDVGGLAQSRRDADRALRVLRSRPSGKRAARIGDVWTDSLLLQLGDLAAAEEQPLTEPLTALLAYDTEHGSGFVETLRAWLEAFGDVNAAAAAVNVHPNTFRYRLKRLAEIGDLDLSDPQVRFAALLQLYLMPGRAWRDATVVSH